MISMRKTFISDDEQKFLDGLHGLRRPMQQEWEILSLTCPVADIGKIGIPDGILHTRVNWRRRNRRSGWSHFDPDVCMAFERSLGILREFRWRFTDETFAARGLYGAR
jgi:hypothetical protein